MEATAIYVVYLLDPQNGAYEFWLDPGASQKRERKKNNTNYEGLFCVLVSDDDESQPTQPLQSYSLAILYLTRFVLPTPNP